MPLAACPTREELSSYVLGKLPDDSSAALDEHLLECTKCQTALETLAVTADSLLADLQRPASQQEYFAESECHEAMALVQAIGCDPSSEKASGGCKPTDRATDLGSIHVYKLLVKLGEGGMGAVYKALHTHLNKIVALKLLPKQQTADQHAVARFKREMLAVGALEHPNIVRATDAGEHEGVHFLVMEYVKGQDLSKISRHLGPLPIAEACELIRQAAVGLQHAHEHGLIHRDIKPSNLMLAVSGHPSAASGTPSAIRNPNSAIVKILDLGLALLQEHQADNGRDLTSTGQMMGTLDYMAPEQGDDSHEVDIRADIYSLGATLYKLLCGEAPFGGPQYNTPVKKLMALASEAPQSISQRRNGLPDDLVQVVHKMLAKDPGDRFATPTEAAAALIPFVKDANLAALLTDGNAEDAENAEEKLSAGTEKSIKSGSVETAPTIDMASNPSVSGFGSTALHSMQPSRSSTSPKFELRSQAGRWWNNRRFHITAITASIGGIIFLGIITLLFQTKNGTIVVKIEDPEGLIQATVVGQGILITDQKNSGEPIRLEPGDHKLHVQRGGLKFETDSFTLERGNKIVLDVRWSDSQVQVLQDERIVKRVASPNYALEFDGKSSYVAMPNLTFDGCKECTLEGYFMPDPTHFQTTPIAAGATANLYCCLRSNALDLRIASSSDGHRVQYSGYIGNVGYNLQRSPYAVLPERFHVAVCWDGREIRLYVNGRLSMSHETGTGKTFVVNPKEHRITCIGNLGPTQKGAELPHSFPFRGRIDEIRLSTVARYDKNFSPAQRFKPDKHTLALYHFDDGPGSKTVHDSSGNKHHGTIHRAKWVEADPVVSTDLDRRVAEWALRKDSESRVAVEMPGPREPTIAHLNELPAESFRVVKLNLFKIRFDDEALAMINSLTALREIRITSQWIPYEQLDALIQQPTISSFSITGRDLTHHQVQALADRKQITKLGITNCRLGTDLLAPLTQATHLEQLSLGSTRIDDGFLRRLEDHRVLNALHVTGTQVTAKGVAELGRTLPNCSIVCDFTKEEVTAAAESRDEAGEPNAADAILTSLVGHWTFDEGHGVTAEDSSGNGHHGTLKNMDEAAWVTADTDDLPPLPGNRAALKFDGNDDVVTVPHDAALDLDGPFTLSAWVRRPAEPELIRYERIIDHHFVNGYAFVLMNMKGLKGQTAMHIAGGNAIAYNSHGPSVMDGKWHHVAAVCDGNALRIYQDGKPLVKGRINRGKPTTKAPLAFGNNASSLPGEEGFHGWLDEIRIYNRALSDAEIKALAGVD